MQAKRLALDALAFPEEQRRDRTQHLLLPRTVESRSRVIHVPSLAPVLPRGPVTYGPSFAFSLSELDWIKSCFQLP